MKIKIFLAIVAIICVLYSCNSGREKARIKTRSNISKTRIVDNAIKLDTTIIDGGVTTTNFYNDTGKLISQISSNGNKTIYAQTGNMLIATKLDSTGKMISRQTDFLNGKGATDSFFVEQNGQITETRKYVYDANGNWVENRQYQQRGNNGPMRLSMVWKEKFSDGDVIEESYTDVIPDDTILTVNPVTLEDETVIRHVNQPHLDIHYEYYADKFNLDKISSNSKNLIKTSVALYSPKDTSEVKHYRYAFDKNGRILAEVSENDPRYKDGSGSTNFEYDSTAYTYY